MSGVFGVVAKGDCREDLFYGTDYHSHLGTQFAGLAVYGPEGLKRKIHDISASQFKSKFHGDCAGLKGPMGIGVISAKDEQPLYVNSKFGPLVLATNGFIENAHALVKELYCEGHSFSEVTDGNVNLTELAAKIIVGGRDIIDGIKKLFARISGSCSLLILTKEGVYAARDRLGYSSLVIGEKPGSRAVATEASSFPNLGYAVRRDLEPGEIVLIKQSGVEVKAKGRLVNQICSFLWIYTGFPASSYEGINAEAVRERSGEKLARTDDIAADFVAGVPDSGTAHAIGYAMGAGIPYRRALIKYTPGYGRSYTPPTQDVRDLVAKMKLIPVREIIKGKRVVLCDDSIVRGTQLKNYTMHKLKESGAKEIHLRIACPPLMFPCRFGYSTRSASELVARKAIKAIEGRDIKDVREYVDERSAKHRKMVEWIRKELGATSLRYQKLDDMIEAIGRPREKLCLYCWTGKEPCGR